MAKLVVLVAAVFGAVGSLVGFVVLGGGDGPAWGTRCSAGGPLEAVLATIRDLESSGRYDLAPGSGGASGAYQYVGSTWRSWAARVGIDTAVYPAAWLAPAGVQDQVAAVNVQAILADVAGDVSLVGPVWFLGHVPTSAEWDAVPMPEAGNTLNPRQYQARWMAIFARHNPTGTTPATLTTATVTPGPGPGAGGGSDPASTVTGPVCGVGRDGWALPLDGLAADLYLASHHDYPAIDLPVPTGQPVHAIHAGHVTRAGGWAGTCYPDTNDCPDICGIGVVIVDATNPTVEWTYCHLTTTTVTTGARVTAGDIVGGSGNTGHSTGPHLHVGVRINGTSACPQPLLYALAAGSGPIPDPTSLPTSGCIT